MHIAAILFLMKATHPILMSNIIFFDTDILSSFLLTHHELILIQLFSGRMSLPRQVYDEINKVTLLKGKIEVLKIHHHIEIIDMDSGGAEENLYIQFINGTWMPGLPLIGRGEAASIVLSHTRNGILASSNFRDVQPYVTHFGLNHLGTLDIIEQAYQKNLLSIAQCDHLVASMVRLNRRLPHRTFSDYLASKA